MYHKVKLVIEKDRSVFCLFSFTKKVSSKSRVFFFRFQERYGKGEKTVENAFVCTCFSFSFKQTNEFFLKDICISYMTKIFEELAWEFWCVSSLLVGNSLRLSL